MKKVLVISAVTLAFAFVTTLALSGGAAAGNKKGNVVVAPVAAPTAETCTYPENLSCPHTAEEEDLYLHGRDITPEQKAVVEAHWADEANLTPEEIALDKAIMAQTPKK